MKAQDTDLTAKYQWKPVQVGAGGWMRGLAVAPTGTAAYARGDVGQRVSLEAVRRDSGIQPRYSARFRLRTLVRP